MSITLQNFFGDFFGEKYDLSFRKIECYLAPARKFSVYSLLKVTRNPFILKHARTSWLSNDTKSSITEVLKDLYAAHLRLICCSPAVAILLSTAGFSAGVSESSAVGRPP